MLIWLNCYYLGLVFSSVAAVCTEDNQKRCSKTCEYFIRITGGGILASWIHQYNLLNSRFQRFHNSNFVNSLFQFQDFNYMKSRFKLHESRFQPREFTFCTSLFLLHEFKISISSWNCWNHDFKKLKLWFYKDEIWKSWICEVGIVNSWSRNGPTSLS